MKTSIRIAVLFVFAAMMLALVVQAGTTKLNLEPLKGRIITNASEIDVPAREAKFVEKLQRQDRAEVVRDDSGRWVIHFVAFFRQPLPTDVVGVVVLDAKGEPIAVAEIPAVRGQTNLASYVIVDATETPRQPHTLQVFYVKGNKPVVLAKKPIVLK